MIEYERLGVDVSADSDTITERATGTAITKRSETEIAVLLPIWKRIEVYHASNGIDVLFHDAGVAQCMHVTVPYPDSDRPVKLRILMEEQTDAE